MKNKKQVSNLIFFGLTVGLLIYICYIGIKNVFRYNVFQLELRTLQTQLAEQKKLHQKYTNTLEAMNDETFWEAQSKQQLRLVKPGEVVYKFKDEFQPTAMEKK